MLVMRSLVELMKPSPFQLDQYHFPSCTSLELIPRVALSGYYVIELISGITQATTRFQPVAWVMAPVPLKQGIGKKLLLKK
jgi:hypothetical protein